ncbi:unnamed protein product [Allacma fusca]|uniref:Peptidase S1 domain-containing protein n=1 Tax=Allacma fusca TaxID=39272 RepID=A0A8J2PC95_9HEXA|nr:unnamed protein product [Allacma fusca]
MRNGRMQNGNLQVCIVDTNAARLSNTVENFENSQSRGNERIQLGDPVGASKFAGALIVYVNGKYSSPFCTSSLITKNRVLTAAHCFDVSDFKDPRVTFKFVFGLSDIREESINANANNPNVSIIPFTESTDVVHHNYTGSSDLFLNDISIIKLSTPVTAPQAEPITLAKNEYTTNIYDVGWGRKNCTHASVETLRIAKGHVLTQERCNSDLIYSRNGTEFYGSQLCALFTDQSNEMAAVSSGDSGGPLFYAGDAGERIQIGVTSHVVFSGENYDVDWRCTIKLLPQTFTRVSSFQTWIEGLAPEAKFARLYEDKTGKVLGGLRRVLARVSPEDEHSTFLVGFLFFFYIIVEVPVKVTTQAYMYPLGL